MYKRGEEKLPFSAKSLSVNDLVEVEVGLGDDENCCLRPTVDFAGDLLEVKEYIFLMVQSSWLSN